MSGASIHNPGYLGEGRKALEKRHCLANRIKGGYLSCLVVQIVIG